MRSKWGFGCILLSLIFLAPTYPDEQKVSEPFEDSHWMQFHSVFPSLSKNDFEVFKNSIKTVGLNTKTALAFIESLKSGNLEDAKRIIGSLETLPPQTTSVEDLALFAGPRFRSQLKPEPSYDQQALRCFEEVLAHLKRSQEERKCSNQEPPSKWNLTFLPQTHWIPEIDLFPADKKEKYIEAIFRSQLDIYNFVKNNQISDLFAENILGTETISHFSHHQLQYIQAVFPGGKLPVAPSDFSPQQKHLLASVGASHLLVATGVLRAAMGTSGKYSLRVRENLDHFYTGMPFTPYSQFIILNVRELAMKESIEEYIDHQKKRGAIPRSIALIYGSSHDFKKYFQNHPTLQWQDVPCLVQESELTWINRPFSIRDLEVGKENLKPVQVAHNQKALQPPTLRLSTNLSENIRSLFSVLAYGRSPTTIFQLKNKSIQNIKSSSTGETVQFVYTDSGLVSVKFNLADGTSIAVGMTISLTGNIRTAQIIIKKGNNTESSIATQEELELLSALGNVVTPYD